MAYEVLARKWRPKNFSELIGQEPVQKTLVNALTQNRLYPVLLFTGPRGTGKTSSARILAKTLRCPNQTNFIPCDTCEDCFLIQESRHLDVIEIDGASNNGVEAVRELRDTVSYLPSTGSWKIYIIDEAHMLSNSAFNALLKTFEEPPKHVLFIMATTESHKIPQTVLSRCQRLDFRLLSPNLIKDQLKKICSSERISIEEGALWVIAKQAKGSLRDAQSLLDQMITFCGEGLTQEKVMELMGLSDPHVLFHCLKTLVHRREHDIIEIIQDLRSKGNEPKLFLQSLIEAFRNLLLLKSNPDNKPPLVQASNREIEEMKEEIRNSSTEDLHLLFDMLLKGEREMLLCYDSQLVLEALLLRLCSAPRLESLIPLGNTFKPEEKKTVKTENKAHSKAFSSEQEETNFKSKNWNEKLENKHLGRGKTDTVPFDKRLDFLEYLKKKDPLLSGWVEQLCLNQKSPEHFCFTVPEKFSYLYNKITEPAHSKSLENYLMEFLKLDESVKIEFLSGDIKEPNLKMERMQKEEKELSKLAMEDAFLKEVETLFQAGIKRVEKKN